MKKQKNAGQSNIVSVSTARRQFGQITRRAKNHQERFIITYRGKPKAIIVGIEEFITIVAPRERIEALVTIRRDKDKP
jgi:prevent-host-death family protein